MAVSTEKLARAAQNEEFMSKIGKAETVEELQSICSEYGADYSVEEIRELAENSDGSSELDEVYGGCVSQGSQNFSKAIYWLPNIISRGCGTLKFR